MKRLATCLSFTLAMSISSFAFADAKEVFSKKCATCHGADGKGKTKMGEKMKAKDWTDAKVQAALTDADIEKGITDGVKARDTGKEAMPAYKDKLKPEEIKELSKMVRDFKGK